MQWTYIKHYHMQKNVSKIPLKIHLLERYCAGKHVLLDVTNFIIVTRVQLIHLMNMLLTNYCNLTRTCEIGILRDKIACEIAKKAFKTSYWRLLMYGPDKIYQYLQIRLTQLTWTELWVNTQVKMNFIVWKEIYAWTKQQNSSCTLPILWQKCKELPSVWTNCQ